MFNKRQFGAIASLGFIFGVGILQADTEIKVAPQVAETSKENENKSIDIKALSETIGNSIGRNLKLPEVSFDIESLIQGIRDGAAGKPAPLDEKQFQQMSAILQEKIYKEKSENNLKIANAFMEKNKSNADVKEIVPGKLQYKTVKEGSGAVVEAHSSPKIHYTGKYENGTVFGTSEEMGGPITIPLDQTIPGFSKGIVGMKEGEKRELYVHPDLGYGTAGQLPPNELLIFDIEVVKANSDENAGKDKDSLALSEEDDEESSSMDDEDDDIYSEEVIEEKIVPVTPAKKEEAKVVPVQPKEAPKAVKEDIKTTANNEKAQPVKRGWFN